MTKRILLADDDTLALKSLTAILRDAGYSVDAVSTVNKCLSLAVANSYDLAILDLMMPASRLPPLDTKAGYETGIELARRLLAGRPEMKVAGMSQAPTAHAKEWFARNASGLWDKGELLAHASRFTQRVEAAFHRPERVGRLQAFIVHGHDHGAMEELRRYLTAELGMPTPIVLTEVAWRGRTIIEKFEESAEGVDVVFVLMTPDDLVSSSASDPIAQARPNVLVELGYFLGRMARRGGRTIILMKGPLGIPSDLAGVGYIDISNGVESSASEIYRELSAISDDF
jgi:predicted nucleotide-binding protein